MEFAAILIAVSVFITVMCFIAACISIAILITSKMLEHMGGKNENINYRNSAFNRLVYNRRMFINNDVDVVRQIY